MDATSLSSPIYLQPLSIAELLDRAIRLYRNNFFTFVGIFAVFQIPVAVFTFLPTALSFFSVTTDNSFPAPLSANNLEMLVSCITPVAAIAEFVLVSGFASAAITHATAASYLGQPIGISDSYAKSRSSVSTLIGARILSSIYAVGLLIWLIVPIAGWFTGIGILYFYFAAVTTLIASTVVLERQGGASAIRRAWDLTRRRFWPVVGFVLVLSLFAQLAITGPAALTASLLGYLFNNASGVTTAAAQSIIQGLITLLSGLLFKPFQLIAMILLYFDLRVRTEGLDLAVLASPAEDAATLSVLAAAPLPERGRLVTTNELSQFIVLSIAAGIVIVILSLALGSLVAAFFGIFGQ